MESFDNKIEETKPIMTKKIEELRSKWFKDIQILLVNWENFLLTFYKNRIRYYYLYENWKLYYYSFPIGNKWKKLFEYLFSNVKEIWNKYWNVKIESYYYWNLRLNTFKSRKDFIILSNVLELKIDEYINNINMPSFRMFLNNKIVRPLDIIFFQKLNLLSQNVVNNFFNLSVENLKFYINDKDILRIIILVSCLEMKFLCLTPEEIDRYVRWWEYKVYVEFQEDKNSDRFKYWLRKWLMAEEIWWGKVLFRWWIVLRLDKPILTKKEWEKLKKVIEEVRRDIEKEKRVIDNTKRELKDLKENIIE